MSLGGLSSIMGGNKSSSSTPSGGIDPEVYEKQAENAVEGDKAQMESSDTIANSAAVKDINQGTNDQRTGHIKELAGKMGQNARTS